LCLSNERQTLARHQDPPAMTLVSSDRPGLLTPSHSYKPFRYPWAYDFWKIQQQVHWLPEEVPLGEDCKDWATKLDDKERNLLTQIFRFFTQSDVEVGANYMENYMPLFKPVEVRMMLAAFSNMETVHIAAYALLLETIGMPDTEFSAFMEYQEMSAKHDYLGKFGVETDRDILTSMAVFGGFTEGLQLLASFAMLMNFPRFNKMKGMGQIVSWSVRDESLHCEGMMKMFHTFAEESGALTQGVKDDIADCCKTVVQLEDKFIELAFEAGSVEGMTPEDIKAYIRYIADWRMKQLKLPAIYGVKDHPIPWLTEILNGVEHANFFEARATEYSKGATKGDWHGDEGVWASFDQWRSSKRTLHVPGQAE
jgi:ribonucleoside-diphosphate reductase beta chain